MNIEERYDSWNNRNAISQAYTDINKRDDSTWHMLYDNFDMAWLNKTAKNLKITTGDVVALIRKKEIEPHGIMTFTDEPEPQPEPVVDLVRERMDALEARVKALESG